MATTRIMPLLTGKGRTVGKAVSDIIDYVENPEKTDHSRLITSYQCDSRITDAEFLFTKKRYGQKTGRVRGENDVIVLFLQNKVHSPVAMIGDNKTEAVITLPKTANANQKQEVSHGK